MTELGNVSQLMVSVSESLDPNRLTLPKPLLPACACFVGLSRNRKKMMMHYGFILTRRTDRSLQFLIAFLNI